MFHPNPVINSFLNEVDSFEAALYTKIGDGQFVWSPTYMSQLLYTQAALQHILDHADHLEAH